MIGKLASKFQTNFLLERGIARQVLSSRTFSVDSNEYQFLQQSRIPTLHFQKSLPRLPIPPLEKTCERYLTALKPLLSDNEYTDTEKLVKSFRENDGKKLHEELIKHDIVNNHTSYISGPWFDMYLSDRVSLPINYNPVLVFSKSKQADNNSQLVRASNMVISSLRFLKSLRKEILEPDVFHLNPKKSDTDLFRTITRLLPSSVSWYGAYFFKAYPLDMSQYPNLFNSTRIPKLKKDILYKDESAKHIVVLRNGHFFVFDVFDENGNILSPEDIFMCFKFIIEKNLSPNKKFVGYLTTENRDIWAKVREYMVSSYAENFESLKKIDSALFAVCLDDENLNGDVLATMKKFLHGNGFNRWFDKSFSLMFSKDGEAALNFEHSWGDGVAVLRYVQDIYKDTNTNLFVHSNTSVSNSDAGNRVTEIQFTLDEKLTSAIEAAEVKFRKTCDNLSFNSAICEQLGKPHCKVVSVSPDSVMQLAFQVAYYKAYGNFVATYESCSTAAFKHGRTETIRPCTNATKEFAMSLCRKNKPDRNELLELMRKCSFTHGNLTKEAAMGHGFDRHLFGLKDLCSRIGYRFPDIYSHDSYKKINYNILSTSTLASDAVMAGGFGPVVPDGFGIGYVIKNDMCGAVVSSYSDKRNGAEFADALESTLFDIFDIIGCQSD